MLLEEMDKSYLRYMANYPLDKGGNGEHTRERHMCRYFSEVLSIGALLLQCAR